MFWIKKHVTSRRDNFVNVVFTNTSFCLLFVIGSLWQRRGIYVQHIAPVFFHRNCSLFTAAILYFSYMTFLQAENKVTQKHLGLFSSLVRPPTQWNFYFSQRTWYENLVCVENWPCQERISGVIQRFTLAFFFFCVCGSTDFINEKKNKKTKE